MSENIFKGGAPTETPPASPDTPTPTQPQLPPEVAEFIGEGKKYASLEDALRSIPHAQKHIQTLEQEAKEIRERLEAQETLKEMLEAVRSNTPQDPPKSPTTPVIDPANLTQIVNQTIEQREAQNRAKANIATVVSTFQTKFGDKAEEVYEALAKENGLPLSSLNQLAATSPVALLRLAGLDHKQTPAPKMQSSVNTEAFRSNQPPAELSAYVGPNPSTKKMVEAWKNAGEKVRNRSST